MVREGMAVVRLTTADGDVSTVNVLRAGSTFGEAALILDAQTRTATVAALTDLSTLMWRRSTFEQLRADHPEVDRVLLLGLTQHVERLTKLLVEAHREDVPHRLLRRLYELAPGPQDTAYDVPMTQEELASLVGTTRPSANHALKRLEARGLVTMSRGTVRVVDPARLRSLAEA
jgi:CRP-like cAMP-binding protein